MAQQGRQLGQQTTLALRLHPVTPAVMQGKKCKEVIFYLDN